MSEPKEAINKVLASLRRLIPDSSQTLVIACSGGADSMALLFCAQKAGYPLVVVHALHDMRDFADAVKDRDLVAKYCEDHSLSFAQVSVNLRSNGISASEENYRYAREIQIRGVARNFKAKYIATGHHADDQLETILMKLCRGSGLRGLSGIAETHVHNDWTTVRPLLEVSKKDIYAICQNNNIPYNEDATNADTQYTRNAIRHKIIPELKSLFPNCAEKANDAARIMDNAQKMSDAVLHDLKKYENHHLVCAKDCIPNKNGRGVKIPTAALLLANDITIYEWLRSSFASVSFTTSEVAYDSVNKQMVDDVIKAIRSGSKKRFSWSSSVTIFVNKTEVRFVGWSS